MADENTCEICNKQLKTQHGLRGHRLLAHPGSAVKSAHKGVESAKEVKKMSENCPDCEIKEQEIKKVRGELEAATGKTTELEKLNKQLETRDLPDFSEFLSHCENCEGHQKQLTEYRQSVASDVIENLGKPEHKDQLLKVMQAHGIGPAPSKIIIKGVE